MVRIRFGMTRNVFDGIEALAALERHGTASEAAAALRLTQSAVSKRLQALQQLVGYAVVEPDGRRLRITADGHALLARGRPLLAGLQELAHPAPATARATLSVALADSIAASWGPAVVAAALRAVPEVAVELHAHRSVLLLERVRLGRYHAGVSTAPRGGDLLCEPLIAEPLAIVRGEGAADRLVTIEPESATWRAIEGTLRRRHPALYARPREPVESFGAALQMVRAGFGDGLVPLGLLLEHGVPRERWDVVEGLARPVTLASRKTVALLPAFARFAGALAASASAWFAARDEVVRRATPPRPVGGDGAGGGPMRLTDDESLAPPVLDRTTDPPEDDAA